MRAAVWSSGGSAVGCPWLRLAVGVVYTGPQRIVAQVARSIAAERVALALYRPEEDCLVIAATHGYPASVVKDVRIEPGTWVIGHVYASGRPVLVPDVRQMHGMS